MARYQVAIVRRPEKWTPECPDDVPLEWSGPVGMLLESDDLFAALDRAAEHNEGDEAKRRGRWAVVVDPNSAGRVWPAARLCTPLTYKVTPIWWPDGWEPQSPLDIPNCVWQTRERVEGRWLSYTEAEAVVFGLNQQCINHPGTNWYAVVAIENEPLSRNVCYDPSGLETTTEVRRMHVIRPSQGGRGDCSHCPAEAFPCVRAEWDSQPQTVTARHSRALDAIGS